MYACSITKATFNLFCQKESMLTPRNPEMWKTLQTPYLGLMTFPISLTHLKKFDGTAALGTSVCAPPQWHLQPPPRCCKDGQHGSYPLAGDQLQIGSDTLLVVRRRAMRSAADWQALEPAGWTKPIPFYQLVVFKAELHSAGIMETHSPGSSSCYRKTHKQQLASTLLCLEGYHWRLQNKHGYCLISDKQRFLT